MTNFKKSDRVIVYDSDDEDWKLGIILKIIPFNGKLDKSLFPLDIPIKGELTYYIQYIEYDSKEEDAIEGVFVGVDYIHYNKHIVIDTPLTRAMYIGWD